MGSFAQAFEIPKDFPPILREFAKEAIREQPPDIYKFGRDYFHKLLASKARAKDSAEDLFNVNVTASNQEEVDQDIDITTLGVNGVVTQGCGDANANLNPLMGEALGDRTAMLFQEADSDANGTLSRTEFQEVLRSFGEEIGLKPRDILEIMAEADSNDNGVIEYEEFLPVASELIQTMMAKEQYSENEAIMSRQDAAKSDVHDYLMKGLPRHELEASIQNFFREADADSSGELDRMEFLCCLKECGLGFTRRELNLIMTLVDKDRSGTIDYAEFMPFCFSMIIETLSDKIQEIAEGELALSERVHDLLLKANENKDRLSSAAASEYLLNAGLGLRFVQVPAMMSVVNEGEDGLVDSRDVASAVAGIMCALNKIHARQLVSAEDGIVQVFKASRRAEGLTRVAGLDGDEFTDKLAGFLEAKDGGIGGSVESKAVLREAIIEAFPDLDARQVQALETLSEQRADGRWDLGNVHKWGFRTLQELQDQDILVKSIKATVR